MIKFWNTDQYTRVELPEYQQSNSFAYHNGVIKFSKCLQAQENLWIKYKTGSMAVNHDWKCLFPFGIHDFKSVWNQILVYWKGNYDANCHKSIDKGSYEGWY